MSWVLIKQGRLADAEDVALRRAAAIEPNFRSAPTELALWGVLILRAATAAVRQEKRHTVPELLNLATAAAARIGRDQLIYATPFGPTNAGVAKVNFLVEMEQAPEAISAARAIPELHSLPPTWRARFHVDIALAHAELDQNTQSVRALLRAEQAAPEWLRYHATTRRLTGELRERAVRRDEPVIALAARLGLDG